MRFDGGDHLEVSFNRYFREAAVDKVAEIPPITTLEELVQLIGDEQGPCAVAVFRCKRSLHWNPARSDRQVLDLREIIGCAELRPAVYTDLVKREEEEVARQRTVAAAQAKLQAERNEKRSFVQFLRSVRDRREAEQQRPRT